MYLLWQRCCAVAKGEGRTNRLPFGSSDTTALFHRAAPLVQPRVWASFLSTACLLLPLRLIQILPAGLNLLQVSPQSNTGRAPSFKRTKKKKRINKFLPENNAVNYRGRRRNHSDTNERRRDACVPSYVHTQERLNGRKACREPRWRKLLCTQVYQQSALICSSTIGSLVQLSQ